MTSRHPSDSGKSDRRSPDGALWAVLSGRRLTVVFIALVSLIGGGAEALFLVLMTRMALEIAESDGTDRLTLFGDHSVTTGAAIAIAVALVVIRLLLSGATVTLASKLVTDVVTGFRTRLAAAYLHATFEVQQRNRTGQLQELITTFSNQGAALLSSFTNILTASFSLLALLGLALIVDPLGSIVVVGAVLLLGALLRPLRRTVKRQSKKTSTTGMEVATALNEVSQLGMEVHIFDVQDSVYERSVELIERDAHQRRRLAIVRGALPVIYTGLAYLVLVGAIAVISSSGTAQLPAIGAVMLLMLRSLSYGQALQLGAAGVAAALPFVEQLHETLGVYDQGIRKDDGAAISRIGDVRFDHVSFAYVPGEPVLRDVTFEIKTGEVIGIIGPSGGGKTTLVQLLLRLRQPTEGKILSDGRNIRSFAQAEWARRVTFVPQSPNLISGTVADNIRFFRSDVTDEDLVRATQLAHLDRDIAAWPDGMNRRLGHDGARLSGGQQQRLCIARALVERPDLLVLDEPTSALDLPSESLIRETLEQLKSQMTIVIIAHRLSTLNTCDRIMVIQDGQLMAFDTPSRLEGSSDFYHHALALSDLHADGNTGSHFT